MSKYTPLLAEHILNASGIDTGLTLLDVSDTLTATRYRLQSTGLYVQKVNDTNLEINLKLKQAAN